jgi:hypothetical protein
MCIKEGVRKSFVGRFYFGLLRTNCLKAKPVRRWLPIREKLPTLEQRSSEEDRSAPSPPRNTRSIVRLWPGEVRG